MNCPTCGKHIENKFQPLPSLAKINAKIDNVVTMVYLPMGNVALNQFYLKSDSDVQRIPLVIVRG